MWNWLFKKSLALFHIFSFAEPSSAICTAKYAPPAPPAPGAAAARVLMLIVSSSSYLKV